MSLDEIEVAKVVLKLAGYENYEWKEEARYCNNQPLEIVVWPGAKKYYQVVCNGCANGFIKAAWKKYNENTI